MRVGLVCPYAWDTPGGVAAHIHDLRLALMRLGHEAVILAPAEDEDALPEYVDQRGQADLHQLQRVGGQDQLRPGRHGAGPPLDQGLRPRHPARARTGRADACRSCRSGSPTVPSWPRGTASLASSRRDLNAMAPMVRSAMEKVRARIAVSEYARRSLVEYTGGDAVLIPNGVDCSAFAGDADPARAGARPQHADVPGPDRRAAQGPADPARGPAPRCGQRPGRLAAGRRPRRRRRGSLRAGSRARDARGVPRPGQRGGQGPGAARRPTSTSHPTPAGSPSGSSCWRRWPPAPRWWPATSRPSSGCSTRAGPACTSATRTPRTSPTG